ncbi:MAG: hypothetical protein WD738_19270 [Pirellulales bacterium]
MDRQQIGLKLTMDALGLPLSVGSFDDRLILQKIVVIAQIAGVDLGYHFHWYLRGPYSPALTRDAFAVANEAEVFVTDAAGCHLDEASLKRLAQLRTLVATKDRGDLASKLELLGSTVFLLHRRGISGDDTAELQRILKAYGKDFSMAQIDSGLRELDEYGLWSSGSK